MTTPALTARLLTIAAVAALALLAPPVAPSDAATTPPTGPVAVGPTARLEWSMPDRYRDGWRAWRARGATYERSYVNPSSWTLDVDGCGSTGRGRTLTRYEARVTGVGFDYTGSSMGTSCRRRLTNLPRLGTYDVALTVRTQDGLADTAAERVTLRDRLIVSLGDSMASGEGSPDRTGRYRLLNDVDSDLDVLRFLVLLALGHPRPASNLDLKVRTLRPVRWQDKRCHRSARAGHAKAAEALEALDPHSSVTFLSLACSGAEIEHLIDTPYTGQQPPARPQPAKLRPQLAVLRDLLRERSVAAARRRIRPPAKLPTTRRIDALLLSIGINDLGFAGIVHACATNPAAPGYGDPDCVYRTGVRRKLNALPGRYDRLAQALRAFDVDETYITDYPAAPFGRDRGGCGMLGLRLVGIGSQEARAMFQTGMTFNRRIQGAANRNGWNYVEGMTQAFLGRDYCRPSRTRFLVRLEESLDKQGTEHGTSHPNPRGHEALGRLLTRSIGLGLPRYPFVRLKLTIDEVKLGKSVREQLDDVTVSLHASPQQTTTVRRGVQYMGRWRKLGLELTSDVYDPPRPPRYATRLAFDVRPVNASTQAIRIVHTRRDSWGIGAHEVASRPTQQHPDGYLRVRYHVTGERILDPSGPSQPVLAR